MTKQQETAIRCAMADLLGAKQAHDQGNSHIHDWRAHQLTIEELDEAFPELAEVSDE